MNTHPCHNGISGVLGLSRAGMLCRQGEPTMTTITSNSTIGIYLSSPSYTNPVVINPGVTISNIGNGISASPTAWTIQNYGSIVGTLGGGIVLDSGGSVNNAASTSIILGIDGVDINGNAGTVVNDGSIA